jgi:wnt family
MRGVGGHLLRAYHDSSVEVTSLKPISGQRPMSLVGIRTGNEIGDDWLAFYSLSPDYCLADPSLGSVGTQGRLVLVIYKFVPVTWIEYAKVSLR